MIAHAEDIRSARPYLLTPTPLKTLARRVVSIGALVVVDLVGLVIGVYGWSYETVTGSLMRSYGVRRKALLVGDPEQVDQLRASLGSSRGGIDYEFACGVMPGPALHEELTRQLLDELIVADAGLDERELLEI